MQNIIAVNESQIKQS